MSPGLRPEDMSTAIAWLDGELGAEEAVRFEVGLAGDAELAQAVEAVALTDDFLRRRTERAGAPAAGARPARPLLVLALLTAAGVAGLMIALAVRSGTRDRLEFGVALVQCDESAQDFVDGQAALRGLRPPGMAELRNADERPNIEPREFLRAAESALRELALGTTTTARAGFFALPLAIPAGGPACEAVVIAIPEAGRELRLLPEAAELDAAAERYPNRFEPGLHWLPRPPFRLDVSERGAERVRYSRGFLVPVGCRSLVVLVAVRPARSELAGTERERVADWDLELVEVPADMHRARAEAWRRRLEGEGFVVRALGVREP